VRAIYVLEKLPDVSGLGLIEAGCYITISRGAVIKVSTFGIR
jgi:hypothetical protein